MHVIVVGGGAAGLTAAWYLLDQGVRVTVVLRDALGDGASGYNAGGLNPLTGEHLPGALSQLAWRSFVEHDRLQQQLAALGHGDYGLRESRAWHVAFSLDETPELEAIVAVYAGQEGFSARQVPEAEWREAAPQLGAETRQVVECSGNKVLDSGRFMASLAAAVAARGGTFLRGEVTGLTSGQSASQAASGITVATTGGRIQLDADSLVLAIGAWSSRAQEWLGVRIPIAPLKGEILRYQLPGPGLTTDISGPKATLFCRGAGHAWVGATAESVGFDIAPSAAARASLRTAAIRLVPEIAGATLLRHTVCLRPVASDGLPILGQAAGWSNVHLVTGGGRKGILLAPALGSTVAQLVTAGHSPWADPRFSPDRFR